MAFFKVSGKIPFLLFYYNQTFLFIIKHIYDVCFKILVYWFNMSIILRSDSIDCLFSGYRSYFPACVCILFWLYPMNGHYEWCVVEILNYVMVLWRILMCVLTDSLTLKSNTKSFFLWSTAVEISVQFF